jgi:hypothetical protein
MYMQTDLIAKLQAIKTPLQGDVSTLSQSILSLVSVSSLTTSSGKNPQFLS